MARRLALRPVQCLRQGRAPAGGPRHPAHVDRMVERQLGVEPLRDQAGVGQGGVKRFGWRIHGCGGW